MPLLFSADAVAASGTYDVNAAGAGPIRVFVTAKGGTLTSLSVKCGPDTSHLASVDSSVFNSLSANATGMLWLDRPQDLIRLSGVGAQMDLRVSRYLSA